MLVIPISIGELNDNDLIENDPALPCHCWILVQKI